MLIKGFRFGMMLQLAVGPVCLFIFQTATAAGFLAAQTGVIGVAMVDSVYIVAAILGIGALLHKHEKQKKFFHYIGALIIFLFGLSNVLSGFGFSLIPSFTFQATNIQNVFLQTLLLTLSNPLTILFWAGVFSTKILEENITKKETYTFGVGAILSTLFFLSMIAGLGSVMNHFLDNRMITVLNMLVGIILMLFAGKKLFQREKRSS